jgi:hypothetical protein
MNTGKRQTYLQSLAAKKTWAIHYIYKFFYAGSLQNFPYSNNTAKLIDKINILITELHTSINDDYAKGKAKYLADEKAAKERMW